jgi:hypothetical protein
MRPGGWVHPVNNVTIRWPLGSKIPTIQGKAAFLPDGRIEASYTEEELKICMQIFTEVILPIWPEIKSPIRV